MQCAETVKGVIAQGYVCASQEKEICNILSPFVARPMKQRVPSCVLVINKLMAVSGIVIYEEFEICEGSSVNYIINGLFVHIQ